MRLIDADALRKFLHEDDFDTPDERWKPESEFAEMIDASPTVDIKTEVAREIFAEIDIPFQRFMKEHDYSIGDLLFDVTERENKYIKEGVGE